MMLNYRRRRRRIVLVWLAIASGCLLLWRTGPRPAGHPIPATGEPTPAARFGYTPDPAGTARFLASLPRPMFADAAPDLVRAEPRTVLLYRALYAAHRSHTGADWTVGRQGIGDCVSWAWAHAADTHLAVLWRLGDSADWRPAATEAIYGGARVEAAGRSQGGWSDGAYGAGAARWVRDYGIVFRQRYPEFGLDLTTYSAALAKNWGNYGCGGRDDRGRLDELAKQHPIRHVALVTTWDEAAAAIASGYPIAVCSSQGFDSTRDADGFCKPRGVWYHAMCFCGVRAAPRPGLLCLNSWGPTWCSGPKWPADQPNGSFWVERPTVERMLAARDSFCVSGYEGFPFVDLSHKDWARAEPRRPQLEQLEPHQAGEFALAP